MIKRLPSRNQRSKSIKVKHILQICLLVGICFWLAYQVKRSHDKNREFLEKDANTLVKMQVGDQILKLGRKDLDPRLDGIGKNQKNEDEEEDEVVVEDEENKHESDREEENKNEEEREEENKHEEEQEEENKREGEDGGEAENKHYVEEQDEEEHGNNEREDESKGGGDEEIDESDQEKSEAETERDEDFMDEEKEKEEIDERENEKEGDDRESLVESQNTREEIYKADDASSAVAHDTQTIDSESEKDGMQDIKGTYSKDSQTASVEDRNTSLPNSLKPTNLNTSMAMNSVDHLEADRSGALLTTAMGNSSTESYTQSNGTTGATLNASATQTNTDSAGSLQNKVEKLSELHSGDNPTVNVAVTGASVVEQFPNLSQVNNTVSGEIQSNANPEGAGRAENNAAAGGNSTNLGTLAENTATSEATKEAEKNLTTSDTRENWGATEDESQVNNHTSDTYEASSSSKTGTLDAALHDPIDTSDSHVLEEVAQARTDVGTLPDVRTASENGDGTATE